MAMGSGRLEKTDPNDMTDAQKRHLRRLQLLFGTVLSAHLVWSWANV